MSEAVYRVARFRNPLSGMEMFGDELMDRSSPTMIRCSGYVTVTFPPLEPEALPGKLQAVEKAKLQAEATHARTLAELETRRLEILELYRNGGSHDNNNTQQRNERT